MGWRPLQSTGDVSFAFQAHNHDKLDIYSFNSAEIERNRQKVMEINFYLDNQQIAFDQFTTGIREQLPIVDEKDEEKPQTIDENEEEILVTSDNLEETFDWNWKLWSTCMNNNKFPFIPNTST